MKGSRAPVFSKSCDLKYLVLVERELTELYYLASGKLLRGSHEYTALISGTIV